MGRYDGEDYEPVVPCPSGRHQPVPNGQCHVCRVLLTPAERIKSEQFQKVSEHERRGCPYWCGGAPDHRYSAALSAKGAERG